jgi:hypothetical protein
MTKMKLSEHEIQEFSLHGDLKTSQFEMGIPINMLIHKVIFNQFWDQKSIWENINLLMH